MRVQGHGNTGCVPSARTGRCVPAPGRLCARSDDFGTGALTGRTRLSGRRNEWEAEGGRVRSLLPHTPWGLRADGCVPVACLLTCKVGAAQGR